MGFWKELIWTESKPTNTEIVICIRTGSSSEDLLNKDWDICFCSEESDFGYNFTGSIIRNLEDLNVSDRFIQFRVTMSSTSFSVSPSILDLAVTYVTKFAVFFFTTKFVLKKDTNSKSGVLVAQVTEPQNTEIIFGVANKNSSDWVDYTIVEPEDLFCVDDFESIKVGIKMISYADDAVPVVDNFALMIGGDEDSLLNETEE